MHTLQEFVRLARMGTGFRSVSRMLRISPNTESEYRKVFEAEGLLVGDPNDLPEVALLHAVLEKHRPARLAPQQESSVERWAAEVREMHELGAKPDAMASTSRSGQRGSASWTARVKRDLGDDQRVRGSYACAKYRLDNYLRQSRMRI